ncbi:MAG: PolC-type DNA polymerase III [Lachnospiraceae bacterium]|jgi:DNA polymerase-3 subunit alpha (Gram-positive type)|nr:PolC-type DNA polymerase III [Lachnospiraceae bacterium]NBJ80712.1 PolC-type DNA polymerase III [bacterium 1XD42-76]NBK03921.1 PolC-type DNA polymerase III [bacterium 1XD42-94]
MEKTFLDVFPGLHIEKELRELLELVMVERVTMPKDRSSIRIYIRSPKLIHKKNIYSMEEGIAKQLFPGRPLSVKILEKYRLSAQYTPKRLYEVYKDSIFLEFRQYGMVEYNILRRAETEFPDEDTMLMTIEDNLIYRERSKEVGRVLEKIFTERCGLAAEVKFRYIEPAKRPEEQYQPFAGQPVLEGYGSYEGFSGNQTAPGTDGPPWENGISGGKDRVAAFGMANTGSGMTGAGSGMPGDGSMAGAAPGMPGNRGCGAALDSRTMREGGANAAAGGRGSAGQAGMMSKGGFGSGAGAPSAKTQEKSEFTKKRFGEKSGKSFAGGYRGGREGGRPPYRKSENPDVLFGRDFDGEAVEIHEVEGEIGEVILRGKIIRAETRELKSGKKLVIFDLTDFTDSITIKLFLREDQEEDAKEAIKEGSFIKLKGITTIDRFDGELTVGSLVGIKRCEDFTIKRTDNAPIKRVELHCHTKMSDMDGVSEVKDIIKRAKKWGMPALAVTDHGCVQAFPDASHALDKGDPFKVLYGVEGYLVDDLKEIVERSENQSLDDTYVVFDIETTGFSPSKNKIIEIGAVKVTDGVIVDRMDEFVNPKVPIPFEIERLTGINDSMVLEAPEIDVILPRFLEFCGDAVLVAHNASFDVSFISHNAVLLGIPFAPTVVDTVALSRALLPSLSRYKLDNVAKALGVSLLHHHRAVDDAEATAGIFLKLSELLKTQHQIHTLDELGIFRKADDAAIMKMPASHVIILAKNDLGRVNLYRLISWSHVRFFSKRPRIPKSLLEEYREGLIIGSACEAGELYQAILRDSGEAELQRLVKFYDYLEIQPLGNDMFMLRDEKSTVKSVEDLQDINRRIVSLGEQWGKPVCATCDVHFLDPEDAIYRKILMAGQGFKDSEDQAPLYLRTTEEMLAEFEYLGSDKAYEVVVTNTRMIADMCEPIAPVRPDKCPPVIERSDETLRNICYSRAHEMYGDELPKIVVDRLEKELNSIISNGFAVMYIIAQKLVWKSNEDGYLVGSRGSVGSSFVATMAGITEVNPLSPHYYCTNCHYYDFDSEEVRGYSGMAGCDMPDKLCPVCKTPLTKDGFDIPFETFLGFKGDKEPDIDLNFSGEYQSRAHDYTEVIFGKGQTFRAGTIGTLADKTAYGYVKNYFEEHGERKRNCEINRIVQGCVGVRRTTGQHPGGIVVLPLGEMIYSFTPVQHPANDMTTKTITTHFDYHSIDHNLLKLDILGHDDPTMIRMLQDLIGLDPVKDIPLDSKEVMSLFQNTSALGITPEDIGGCKLGALGVPEFGTDFAMQMLIDTKPKYFSDLVRIAGLAHGTDVWLGNAQTLIQEGKATIQTAICTRDDIMVYLINQGLEEGLAFTIMESVRKGKGLKPEWEEAMVEKGVPDWYIWSCKKIKYMFPKAHAAAYVMMAWRIAYCKVFYPLAYYAAFFSIRANGFSYGLMCLGRDKLEFHLADYKRRLDSLSKKEQDTLRDMRIVQEMYARGYEFMPMDLYRAKARQFQIIDDKLMPSINSIDGLGEKAADSIEEAAKDGAFLSKEDFRNRAKVGKTLCDLMAELGILKDLPESNQLSLFDL